MSYWFKQCLILSIMLCLNNAYAEPWAPSPNVAVDTGNWSNATFQELQIRLNGFRGYETTRIAGVNEAKLHHPQHIVRLPNKGGHAYFAITQSNRFYTQSIDLQYTDGYWMVIEVDADAYDRYSDQIIQTAGSDGRYVYEEHFSNNRDEALKYYSGALSAKGSQMVISDKGDWIHPAKMTQFGGILVMVGQNWSPLGGLDGIRGVIGSPQGLSPTVGDSLDAVLFYDVRDPVHPNYLGMLDSDQLGVPEGNGDGGKPKSWRKIDSIGLAKSENGIYHLGVQNRNFFCHESEDCFSNPIDMNKWKAEDTPSGKSASRMAGGQGDIFQSLEKYAAVPNADEVCYGNDGARYNGGQLRPAECTPAGIYRTMWFEAVEDSVLPNDFSFVCDIIGEECGQGSANKMGIPSFATLKYDLPAEYIPVESTVDATTHFAGKDSSGTKNKFMYQLYGDCSPGGGIHVNNNKEPLIYCVSESANEPFGCPEGMCNSLYQNAASAAPSYGAIKFTNSNGDSVIYRGRGMPNMAALSEPPWGPGIKKGAVDWDKAAITKVTLLSGKWMIYTDYAYGTPNGNSEGSLSTISGKGEREWNKTIKSFRVLPEEGLNLFEAENFFGRMLSNTRSNPSLTHACGDDQAVCYAWQRENNCNVFGSDCDIPRSFHDKASSLIVSSGWWTIYEDDYYNGASVGKFSASADVYSTPAFRNEYGFNDKVTSVATDYACTTFIVSPDSLSYTMEQKRPVVIWTGRAVHSFYVVGMRRAGDVDWEYRRSDKARFVFPDKPSPGEWEFIVASAIGAGNGCSQKTGSYSEVLTIIVPPDPVEISIEQVSTDIAGLGSGSVSITPESASTLGGNYYMPGDVITLTATPGERSEFDRWAGQIENCGTRSICDIVVTDILVTNAQAIFRPKPSLTVSVYGGGKKNVNGIVDIMGRLKLVQQGGEVSLEPFGSECGYGDNFYCNYYSTGQQVNLYAIAYDNRAFDSWRGDDDCLDGSVTLTEDLRCEAWFKHTRFDLTVNQTPGVEITSDPAGDINCGTQSDCAKTYDISDSEQTVTLKAKIAPDYIFVRWSGSNDCYDEDERDGDPLTARVKVGAKNVQCEVIAVPEDTEYALTMETIGGGTVTAEALPAIATDGINCASNACSQLYPIFTQVKLTAIPSRGSRFIGFKSTDNTNGDFNFIDLCVGGEINMVANLNCVASFATKVLIVKGTHDSKSKEQNPYINILPELHDYDIWHVQNPNSGDNSSSEINVRRAEPVAEDLANYGRVVWYTGSAKKNPDADWQIAAGPSPEAEGELAKYLDAGGCLLMSSPEYYKDRGLTPFMQNYLGVKEVIDDAGESSVKGAGEGRFGFSELNSGSGSAYRNDILVHNSDLPGIDAVFTYSDSGADAAIAVDNGIYRTVFMGFPLLSTGNSKRSTLGAFMDLCGKPDSDDAYEVNDDIAMASERTGTVAIEHLRVMPDNEDYFSWTSDGYADTVFSINFTHADGDLNLAVYDENTALIEASEGQNDGEQIIIDGVKKGERYYVRVYGANEKVTNTYALNIRLTGGADFDNDGAADVDDALPEDPTEQYDSDGDLIGNNADPDDDNDGLPDAYELANGFDPLVASDTVEDDADGDGYSDFEEYLADTDPNDASSTPPEPTLSFFLAKSDRVRNDVDGDGKSDLLWRSNAKGWNFLWAMDGVKTKQASPINVVQDDGWLMAGQGDYDADGKSDILWRNTLTGLNFIYLMDGLNIKAKQVLNYVDAPKWELRGSGDFNGDGKGDVLWRNVDRGDTWFYMMDGLSIGTNQPSLWVTDLNYKIVAIGDINGDGTDDVIWRNQVTGVNYIWIMQDGQIADRYTLNAIDVNWTIAGAGDLDGDGTDDIILRNQVDGRNWAYLMEDGQIKASELINTVGMGWQIADMGDYDGDGKADLLWRNESTARNIVHLMDGLSIKDKGVLRPTNNTWQLAQ
jgi:hypothetical protein